MRLIERVWFYRHPAKWLLVPLLLPLSIVFWAITGLRRWLYRVGVKQSVQPAVPVLVIGNIGIGGNGKTPLALYLIKLCQSLNIRVGVVSRGYGGKAEHYPYLLDENSTAELAGDEPQMIYQRTGVPIAVGSDRIAAIDLLAQQGCQLVLADDGLQHYRMQRQGEIIVVDGKRQFGNGLLLPTGPLREGKWRLSQCDVVVVNGQTAVPMPQLSSPLAMMSLQPSQFINLSTNQALSISDFAKRYPQVNAIAAIGDPARFFTTLKQCNIALEKAQGFVDHHVFNQNELMQFGSILPLVMTEKDAVKCKGFEQANWWYLAVDASLDAAMEKFMTQMLTRMCQLNTDTSTKF